MFKGKQLTMCTLGFWSRIQVGGISYTWKQALGKRGHRARCKAGDLVGSLPGVDFGSTLGKASLRVNS